MFQQIIIKEKAKSSFQLLGMAIPYFQKLQKEGESGRRKINNITRYLTILITGGQAPGYIANLKATLPAEAFLLSPGIFWFSSIVVLVTGTMFVMWLGEKITDRGIGNGISLLIMIGIIASFPQSLMQEFVSALGSTGGGLIIFMVEMLILLFVIAVTILLVQGTRRIPVQYAKRVVGNKPGFYKLNEIQSIDIDTEFDFKICESLFKV